MWNKATQILQNEVRKINVKISAHENAIRKLNADKKEIEISINKSN
jgi:hypothetical protein